MSKRLLKEMFNLRESDGAAVQVSLTSEEIQLLVSLVGEYYDGHGRDQLLNKLRSAAGQGTNI